MEKKLITVVIPTLGKKNLNKLLKKLVYNNLVKEILISIPNLSYNKLHIYNSKKIKILVSKFKHQVRQRIICYKKIKTKYTILLDDDVDFDNNFIKNLLKIKIEKGNKSVVGPVYYDHKNFEKIHKNNLSNINIMKQLMQSTILGIPLSKNRMGKISKAGTCYGVDPDFMPKDSIEVDWIPGGCMIISTNQLIHKNYFNISGKAYCEDLIHSYLFKKKNLKLYIHKKSKIYTDSPKKLSDRKDLKYYLSGHRLFCKYAKLYNLRVIIWRTYLYLKLKILF